MRRYLQIVSISALIKAQTLVAHKIGHSNHRKTTHRYIAGESQNSKELTGSRHFTHKLFSKERTSDQIETRYSWGRQNLTSLNFKTLFIQSLRLIK